jgi:hypothetical protein
MKLLLPLLLVPATAAADKRTDLDKAIGGTWSCKGTIAGATATARLRTTSDLDGSWIHQELVDGRKTFAQMYTTYDVSAKRYRRVVFGANGSVAQGEARLSGSKLDAELDRKSDGGDGKMRDHLDWSTAKTLVLAGELDNGGGNWVKTYDLTCTRGADAFAKMTEFKDRMCACKDQACADKVNADYQKAMTDMARDFDGVKPTDDDMKRGAEIAKAYGECIANAMGAGRP